MRRTGCKAVGVGARSGSSCVPLVLVREWANRRQEDQVRRSRWGGRRRVWVRWDTWDERMLGKEGRGKVWARCLVGRRTGPRPALWGGVCCFEMPAEPDMGQQRLIRTKPGAGIAQGRFLALDVTPCLSTRSPAGPCMCP